MMACDFCNGKTSLDVRAFNVKIEDGELKITHSCSDPWYSETDYMEVNNCPMCGRKLGDTND